MESGPNQKVLFISFNSVCVTHVKEKKKFKKIGKTVSNTENGKTTIKWIRNISETRSSYVNIPLQRSYCYS